MNTKMYVNRMLNQRNAHCKLNFESNCNIQYAFVATKRRDVVYQRRRQTPF